MNNTHIQLYKLTYMQNVLYCIYALNLFLNFIGNLSQLPFKLLNTHIVIIMSKCPNMLVYYPKHNLLFIIALENIILKRRLSTY